MHGTEVKKTCLIVVMCLFFFLAFACARSESARFYRLSPIAGLKAAQGTVVLSGTFVSLGPVRLPAYLNRPQIVTLRDNRVEIAEFDRWAGSLEENVANVLQRNLASILEPHGLNVLPFRSPVEARFSMPVDILALDVIPSRSVSCTAQWVVREKGGEERREILEASLSRPVTKAGYAGVIEAMNIVLADLSARMAESLLCITR